MASEKTGVAPKMEFGRWSYISRLSWTVLASILGGLGVDFAPLGVHLGSNLAAKIAPELPKSAQEPPKNGQEPPKTAQECPRRPRSSPGAAQDSPRASQKPTKMPRSSPRPDQRTAEILPRTWPETTHYPRLEKTPNFTTHSLEPISSPQSGRNQKRAAAVLPPRGSSIRRPTGVGV